MQPEPHDERHAAIDYGARENRVLVAPATRRDGAVSHDLLTRFGLTCLVCPDLSGLAREIGRGGGAVLLTEWSLSAPGFDNVREALGRQEPWSDLPLILLLPAGASRPHIARIISELSNVTILERPAPMRTVVSAVQSALRARARQYQARGQLEVIRQAQQRMQKLQEQYAFALDASQLGTFHCPMPLGQIVVNDRCKEQFFLPPDAEFNFELFYSIVHPDDRDRIRAAIADSVERHLPYEVQYRVLSPRGETRWLRATGRTYFDTEDNPARFDGTTLDVTSEKLVEAALRETQERFEAMANTIPQLAWMANRDGWIFWYNRRWYEFSGTTEEQVCGWGWDRIHDPQELPRVLANWRRALASGEPWEDTFPLRRHDGEYRWHLSRARPYRDANGEIVLWFGTNTDVTEERQRAEERRQLLEREQEARLEAERASRMKDGFLATLSHELRTPLNAIFGWTQLLKAGQADEETVSQAVEVIDRNVRVQAQLIEDLLDMSRIISGKVRLDVRQIELPAVIDAALESVRPAIQAKGIRLEKVVDPRIGAVSGDFGRLQQVLWNLLTNAAKFTPKGGRIHLLAQRVNSQVEISIADTGEGIDPEFLPRLFERFSQADGSTTRLHGGLGIGLSIVKQLVEMHGGTICASSPGLGRGATFVVCLPLRPTRILNDAEHPRSSLGAPTPRCVARKLHGLRVLVVDDEPDARELIKRLLSDSDARPAVAASAEEAIEKLADFEPQLILSDIGMPGEDGYEFMRRVRSHGIKVPAIALTAFARSEDRIRSLEAGYQAHLPKPVEPAELLALVARLADINGSR